MILPGHRPIAKEGPMNRISILVACVLLILPVMNVGADDKGHGGTAITVTGEILDMACYVAHGAKGPQHEKCAVKCAEQGQPIGLLAKDGKVYVLFADHADPTAYEKAKGLAGKNAELKGEVASRDGINGLTVLAAKPV
jgi:hypothetical protein